MRRGGGVGENRKRDLGGGVRGEEGRGEGGRRGEGIGKKEGERKRGGERAWGER